MSEQLREAQKALMDALFRMKGGEYIDTSEIMMALDQYVDVKIAEAIENRKSKS